MSEFEKEGKFNKAIQIIKEASKDKDFCIDGDSDKIGDISLEDIRNMGFSSDIEEELVLVRTDERFPINDIVQSPMEGGALYDSGKAYINRNTSHWCLNGMVSNNLLGDFTGRDFIIIQPFKDVDDEMLGFEIQDMFYKGHINLKNAIIAIRDSRFDEFSNDIEKSNNTIVKFKGNEKIVAEKLLVLMEKKPQIVCKDGWTNEDGGTNPNTSKVIQFAKERNYPLSHHFYSLYHTYEENASQRDKILFDMRGHIVDTRYENVPISMEEMANLYNKLGKEKTVEVEKFYDFMITNGIGVNANEEYEIINTQDALNQYEKYSREKGSPYLTTSGIADFEERYQEFSQKMEEYYKQQSEIETQKRIEEIKKKQRKELAPEDREIFSKMEQKTIKDANTVENLNISTSIFASTEEVYDRIMEMAKESEHFTIHNNDFESRIVTDFRSYVEEETVEQYINRLHNYIANCIKLYNGEAVKFDQDGNIVEDEKKFNMEDYEKISQRTKIPKDLVKTIKQESKAQDIKDQEVLDEQQI